MISNHLSLPLLDTTPISNTLSPYDPIIVSKVLDFYEEPIYPTIPHIADIITLDSTSLKTPMEPNNITSHLNSLIDDINASSLSTSSLAEPDTSSSTSHDSESII